MGHSEVSHKMYIQRKLVLWVKDGKPSKIKYYISK